MVGVFPFVLPPHPVAPCYRITRDRALPSRLGLISINVSPPSGTPSPNGAPRPNRRLNPKFLISGYLQKPLLFRTSLRPRRLDALGLRFGSVLREGVLLSEFVERHLQDGVLRLESPDLTTQRIDNCLWVNVHVSNLSLTMGVWMKKKNLMSRKAPTCLFRHQNAIRRQGQRCALSGD